MFRSDWWRRRVWARRIGLWYGLVAPPGLGQDMVGETERFAWWELVDQWRYGPVGLQ
jgi:hypothetical protein